MSNQLQITGEAKIRTIQGPVVANSGVITALDGDASEYVRGDGTLADFPTSTGGGSSVSYYLNTSVSQGTIGGVAYKQLSKTPISGAGTDVSISADGYIASYITDANDPALLEVPAGNFNCEFYFSVNSNAHNPYVYAEVYKYDGTTFTLLGSNVSIPQYLSNGTTLSPYYFAIAVSTAVLTVTDRIAIRIYVNVDGRTVTLHTENNHLCQVVTTFSKGLISLNNLTRQNQFFQTGTSGTDFNISSATATHTFNIPDASASARGLITTGIQTIVGAKTFTGNIIADGSVLLKNNVTSFLAGYVNLGGIVTGNGFSVGLPNGGSPLINQLIFNSSAAYNYTFPAATGTLALTSNLSSYVPYTGATTNVDLGTFSITGGIGTFTNGVLNGNGSNPANLYLKKGSAPFFTNAANYGLIAAVSNSFILISDVDGTNYKYASFDLGSLTNNTNRAYTLPDASGTIALTSNLSAYLPLAGGTLTGTLNGTSATFNTNSTSNAGFFQINDATTTLGNSFATVHRNANDGNGRFSLSRWQVQNTSGLDQSAFIGAQAVTGASNYSPNLILGVSNGASSYTTYLTIASTGAATFSSSVTTTKIITTGGNGAEIFNASTATTGSNYFNIRNTGAILFFGIENSTGGSLQTGASAYASVLTTGNATDLSLGTGQVQRMVIKATTGNVGIGSSPATVSTYTVLEVAGPNTSTGGMIRTKISDNSIIGKFYSNSTGVWVSSETSHPLIFETANTERMRITSAGFLKASNNGTYLSATGTYYEFNSDLNSIVQLWNITNASYADDVHQIRVTRAATSAYYFGSYYSGVTSDKEFGFRGDGVGYSDGGWTTPASDYAEYFESIDGTALPIGSTVSLVGNKIKIADDGETIIGVIRPKDAQLFLGNNASEKWNQKYLKNDYGSYLKDENDKRILNPNYDSTIEYIPRENRLEWNVIGLMGQIPIKKGQPTNPNWVKMKEISQEVELWLVK